MSFVMSAPLLPLLANKNKVFPRHGKVSALLDVLLDVVLVALLDVALVVLSDVFFVPNLLSRRALAFLVFFSLGHSKSTFKKKRNKRS